MPEISVPKEFKDFKICGWINFNDGTSELVIRYDKFDMFTERFITINGNEYVRKVHERTVETLYSDNNPYLHIPEPDERWRKRIHVHLNTDVWEPVFCVKDYLIIVIDDEKKAGFTNIVNFNVAKHIVEDAIKIWGLSVSNLLLEEENKRLLEKNNKLMGDLSEVQKNYNSLKGDITSLIDKLEAKKNTEKEKNN